MATTITTARDQVRDRLLLDGTPAGAEPSDAIIETWVRQGFKRLWAWAPPVFRDTFAVVDGNVATVHASLSDVLFVASSHSLLVPVAEYQQTETGLNLKLDKHIAYSNDVLVWFTTSPTTFGADASIESSCMFGPDWLEEAVLLYAEIQLLTRISRVSETGGGAMEGQLRQSLEQTFNQLMAQLVQRRETWFGQMNTQLNVKMQTEQLAVTPAIAGFSNQSYQEHHATGKRTR